MVTDALSFISRLISASLLLLALVYSNSSIASLGRTEADCKKWLESQLPRIKPLVLKKLDQPFDDPEYQFEVKYDGYRGIAYFERGQGCRFISREGNILRQFRPLCETIAAELHIQDAIFDGEVIAHDLAGRPIFNNIQRQKEPFRYVAFDLLWLNGRDLRSLPLEERRRQLLEILPKGSSAIAESLAEIGNGSKLFQLIVENDLEGIVAKRLDGKYTRSAKWYKIKNRDYSQAVGRGRFF